MIQSTVWILGRGINYPVWNKVIQAKSICICVRFPTILLVIDLRKLKCYKIKYMLRKTHFLWVEHFVLSHVKFFPIPSHLGEALKREPQVPARWSRHCTELQWQLCWGVWLNSCLCQPKKEDNRNLSEQGIKFKQPWEQFPGLVSWVLHFLSQHIEETVQKTLEGEPKNTTGKAVHDHVSHWLCITGKISDIWKKKK